MLINKSRLIDVITVYFVIDSLTDDCIIISRPDS